MISRSESADGWFQLLDMSSGQVREFGQPNSHSCGVFWKPDESEVACFSRVVGPNQRQIQALLVNPVTGELLDFTGFYCDALCDDSCSGIIDGFWTPDGEYLVVNNHHHSGFGGSLLRPRSQEVVYCARQLDRQVPAAEDLPSWRCKFASLSPCPMPGWLFATVYDRGHYVVNYPGTVHAPVPDLRGYVSPNGRYIATNNAGYDGLDIRELDLSLPPPTSDSTSTTEHPARCTRDTAQAIP